MSTIDELNAEIKKLDDEILKLRNENDKYEAQLAPDQQTALGISAEVIGTWISENKKLITERGKQITIKEERIAAYAYRQGLPTALTNFAFIRMC